MQFQARRTGAGAPPEARTIEMMARTLTLPNIRPAMEYGRERLPEQPRHVLVRNATVWTMGPQGILETPICWCAKVAWWRVGQSLRAPRNATVIECRRQARNTGTHRRPPAFPV